MKRQILLFISSFFILLPIFAEYDIDNNIGSVYDAIKENGYVEITKDNIKEVVRVQGNVLTQCISQAFILAQFSLADSYNTNILKKSGLTNDWKKDIYKDFYLSSYLMQRAKIEIGCLQNVYLVELSLEVGLEEFNSLHNFYIAEPYDNTLFSNLYKSNPDFRNFVSRKLTEVK